MAERFPERSLGKRFHHPARRYALARLTWSTSNCIRCPAKSNLPHHDDQTNRTSLVAERVAANSRAFRLIAAQQLRVSLSRPLLRDGRLCGQFSPGPESEGISGDRRQLQSFWVSPSRSRLFLCLR